jgi:hypothetical protein
MKQMIQGEGASAFLSLRQRKISFVDNSLLQILIERHKNPVRVVCFVFEG